MDVSVRHVEDEDTSHGTLKPFKAETVRIAGMSAERVGPDRGPANY